MGEVDTLESLGQLRALAERDASRFAGEPTSRQRSPRHCRAPRGLPWMASVVAVALSGLIWWLVPTDGTTAVAANVAPEPLPSHPSPQVTSPERAPVLGAEARVGARARDALWISHEGKVWRIRADAVPRHEVARTLAELSGTQLPAGIEALRSAPPLDLRWEGTDLAMAWQAVIGGEAHYALKCSHERCMAWIDTAGPVRGDRHAAKVQQSPVAPVAIAPRAGRSAEVSEPSGYD